MTEAEEQQIIDAVLSALRTNSRTIDQLTPTSTLSENDYFEINGSRRVSYSDLSALITSIYSDQISDVYTAIYRLVPDIHPIVEVEDEDAMAQMIANGETDSKTLYYIPE